MSTDTYQKSRRQRKEYNNHMKQIDDSKNLLKSLVKATSIDSQYLLYLKQFNSINNKLATYEKDDKLTMNDIYHKLKQDGILKYENEVRRPDIYINNRSQFNERFYLKLKNGKYFCVYKPLERLNMRNLKNKFQDDKNLILHLEKKIRCIR